MRVSSINVVSQNQSLKNVSKTKNESISNLKVNNLKNDTFEKSSAVSFKSDRGALVGMATGALLGLGAVVIVVATGGLGAAVAAVGLPGVGAVGAGMGAQVGGIVGGLASGKE